LGDRWSLAVGVLAGSDWTDWSQRLPVQTTADRRPPTAEAGSETSAQPLRRFEANTWVRLATFERQGRELVEIGSTEPALQPANPLQANFDGKMELRGYDVSGTFKSI
jgi:hypothetical protein